MKTDFRQFIERLVLVISDIEYQNRIWVLGKGPEVSSYDEITEFLLSEGKYVIDNPEKFNFSDDQLKTLSELYVLVDKYDEHAPDSDRDIVNDPKWLEIVEFAKKAHTTLTK